MFADIYIYILTPPLFLFRICSRFCCLLVMVVVLVVVVLLFPVVVVSVQEP